MLHTAKSLGQQLAVSLMMMGNRRRKQTSLMKKPSKDGKKSEG